jgi:hypothetical protein
MRKLKAHPLVETASTYVGFTARNGLTPFGSATGYNGSQFNWDGSFIDTVLHETDYNGISHAHTVTALAEYIQSNRIFRVPKPGDIVFFNFTTGDNMSAPHVGIVTDVSSWRKHRMFRSVEAQVSTGLPQGGTANDGIYERQRHEYDVLGFARPKKKPASANGYTEKSNLITVLPAHLNRCTTAQATASAKPDIRRAVEAVQYALSAEVGLRNADRAIFNAKTKSALAKFQRSIGLINATGEPDEHTLTELAKRQPHFFRVNGN